VTPKQSRARSKRLPSKPKLPERRVAATWLQRRDKQPLTSVRGSDYFKIAMKPSLPPPAGPWLALSVSGRPLPP
jgi:hypothetical protein